MDEVVVVLMVLVVRVELSVFKEVTIRDVLTRCCRIEIRSWTDGMVAISVTDEAPEEFRRKTWFECPPTLEQGLWAIFELLENDREGPGVLGAVSGVLGVPGGESNDPFVQDGGEGKDS
jgi:hypothetical protein